MAEDETKLARASKIVRNHALAGLGAGALPVPILDIALFTGVQVRMLQQLAKLYDVEFDKQRANTIIATLVSVGATATVNSLLKAIPGYGSVVGTIGVATSAGASTYGIGRVFIKHFESGGTFLTFDPEKARDYYESQVKQGPQATEVDYRGIKP